MGKQTSQTGLSFSEETPSCQDDQSGQDGAAERKIPFLPTIAHLRYLMQDAYEQATRPYKNNAETFNTRRMTWEVSCALC
ncbi:hypothetical protein KSX_85350 [Ktedonospora formicarum]|uniref:Uncharacterized protein n=1 Tax=Ktedonospora formicarum TaxID=2778364 RepID=A0A8J3I4Y6_9CHLR|nr:hypothetical protein KSX_85350 [Ktedonospora formicarum]